MVNIQRAALRDRIPAIKPKRGIEMKKYYIYYHKNKYCRKPLTLNNPIYSTNYRTAMICAEMEVSKYTNGQGVLLNVITEENGGIGWQDAIYWEKLIHTFDLPERNEI